MKKRFLETHNFKKILAVPAAALMLGAASNGATIGINYTANFAASYAADGLPIPSYSYHHYGYMTSGFDVTAAAFGVAPAYWTNIPLQIAYSYHVNTTNTVGAMTVLTKANNAWSAGLGGNGSMGTNYYSPQTVVPGNDQVTWAYLDDDLQKASHNPVYVLWSVQLSGMKAAHPNGYTIQTIGEPENVASSTWNYPIPNANVTDGATFTNVLPYTDLGTRPGFWGPVHAAISSFSPVMTSDTVTIFPDPPSGNKTTPGSAYMIHSTLCGFIITDATASVPLTLSIVSNNVVWSAGTLQSSPTLGSNAVWTTLTNATSPYPVLPSVTPAMFYRLVQTNAP